MRPQDNRDNQLSPSDPPPAALPRPSMQVITDIQRLQRPPQSAATPPTPPQTPTSNTSAPRHSHPNDHLLEPPHEPRLEAGDGGDSTPPPKKKPSKAAVVFGIIAALVIIVAIATVAAVGWYQKQLEPVDAKSDQHVRVIIKQGSAPSQIAQTLKSQGIIRSDTAFSIYTKLSNTENNLKAGTYNLKKSESVQQIVDHLVSGKQDTFSITFLPGDTLANNRKKLIQAGYGEAEVDAALSKQYDRPLFAGKPAGGDLEGYIYGETYEVDSASTVESILARTFDEYEKFLAANDTVAGLKKQNLNLYQGIILASIIQREVSGDEDERQVAAVFYNRLKVGMTLGSDVTYQYAARKMGVDPTPLLESPYNTRIKQGLPPGPISVPGTGALKAVANPGTNDYLFFLSGDDDVTYFAKTDAEHQKNIAQHCKKKCLIN